MIDRKKKIRPNMTSQEILGQKSLLIQKRSLALGRNDDAEVTEVTKELEELHARYPEFLGKFHGGSGSHTNSHEDQAAKEVKEREDKERERQAKLRAQVEQIRREKERQRLASPGPRSQSPAFADPSARVKTVARMRHERSVLDLPLFGARR